MYVGRSCKEHTGRKGKVMAESVRQVWVTGFAYLSLVHS